MQKTQETPTTLNWVEVAAIAEDIGYTYEGRNGMCQYWRIQGFDIVRNVQTKTYQIMTDGEILHSGRGFMLDALRDFIINFTRWHDESA